MSNKYNIGIDLGTSTIAVSVYVDGRIRTIPIDSGVKCMPAYVYFGEYAPSVGRAAQLKQISEPKRVIYSAKRLLGCRYDDPQIQEVLPQLLYDVRKTPKGTIEIVVNGETQSYRYSPSEIMAYLVSQAIKNTSAYLGGEIGEVTVTVPAYYDNIQRNDTLNAVKIAGIDTVHLVSDPTAAAISYGLINTISNEMVLVFDFGGGSLDISVININKKTYTVMSSSGNSHLGGNDVTNNLMKEVVAAFEASTHGDLSKSLTDYMQLYNAVEEAKIALSSVDSYDIDLEKLMGNEFHFTVTRQMLENANHALFAECTHCIQDCLDKALQKKEDITHVIMVGGSSNIPFIHNHIVNMFGKERVWSCMNASEVVSQGAAVVAGISHDVVEKGYDFQVAMYTTAHNIGNEDSSMAKLEVNDMTPMNLGIRLSNGRLSPIIEANSSVPITRQKQYQPHRDGQRTMRFKIYQGLEPMAEDCKLISEIVLEIDTSAPAKETVVEVSFSLDSNSTLYVNATELKTMRTVNKVLDMGSQVLSKDDILDMRQSLHQSMALVDAGEKAAIERNLMTKMILQIQRDLDAQPEGSDIDVMKDALWRYKEWLEASMAYSKDEIHQKCEEMKQYFSSL